MKTVLLFLLLWAGAFCNAFSCVNESRQLLNGKPVTGIPDNLLPEGHDFAGRRTEYEQDLLRLDSLWKMKKDIDAYSDYGVRLIYLGRNEEAKRLYIDIEKRNPGRYATAANLGTTYELLGNNDSALYWIKKAVAINPKSHDESEWLHVKILEAKIGGDQYINSEFLLNTSFGNKLVPESRMDKKALYKLSRVLYYQLNERVSFVKPKDKIVGLLLFELGNICAIQQDVELALRIYDKAREYGYTSPVMQQRCDKILSMREPYSPRERLREREHPGFYLQVSEHPTWHYVLAVIGFLLVSYLAILAFRN